MSNLEMLEPANSELSPEAIREQLEILVQDPVFRSSKRSVQFLRYVVEQTLSGAAEQIKERTIGAEVFGRDPSYDTTADHVVRTAAIELRKRLAIYYGDERHRSELRMSLVPGSYIPRFSPPPSPISSPISPITPSTSAAEEDSPAMPDGTTSPNANVSQPTTAIGIGATSKKIWRSPFVIGSIVVTLLVLSFLGYRRLRPSNPEELFWKPVLDSPGSVLLAVGDIPNGPPSASAEDKIHPVPIIQKSLATYVPFADTVTIARVLSVLQSHGKQVVIRPETSSSFFDFREGPAVLIGAFNNEWSLRLTHQLRFSLALDTDKKLIYIRDAKNPSDRRWSQITDKTLEQQMSRSGPTKQDYALVSRVWNSETGHVVVVIGGLYAYGTEAAGEFLTSPQMMQDIIKSVPMDNPRMNLQMVLETTVTDDTPGVPKLLAVSTE